MKALSYALLALVLVSAPARFGFSDVIVDGSSGITPGRAAELLVPANDALNANVNGQQVAIASMLATAQKPASVNKLQLAMRQKLACEDGLRFLISNLEGVVNGTNSVEVSEVRYTFHASKALNASTGSVITGLASNPTLESEIENKDLFFFSTQNDLQDAALEEGLLILDRIAIPGLL